MTTSIAAGKWNTNDRWVRSRCLEGFIPLAERTGKGWEIPEEADKPPCTGLAATIIMENMLEIAEGHDVQLFPKKYQAISEDILDYLIDWGFIEKLDLQDGTIIIAVVKRGLDLIAAVRKTPEIEKKKKTKFGARVAAGGLEAYAEYSTEQKMLHKSPD